MEKQVQNLGCRVSAIEKNITQLSKTQHELQKEVEGLKISLEKALNSLMPKIDSLISDRTKTVSTVSARVAVPPVFVDAPSAVPKKVKIENKLQATSSTPKSSFTTVFQAAQIGDIATLLSHLKSGTSVNQRDEKGFTLLHLAVSGGHEKMVKALLDAGASVNARGPSYTTPLHLAVEIGFINVLEILLHAGADINTQNTNNETPLLRAVRRGNSDAVNFLIENGASLDEQDREGNTALLLAVKKEDSDMTKLLIAIGASLDKCDRGNKSALWYAVERGANEIVKFVCDKGASVKLGKCPLRLASERGNTEAVMLMLQSKNTSDTVAISNALSSAKDVGVALAFEDSRPGILKANEGAEAMGRAVEQGRVHSLKALLDAGVDVNATCIRYKCFVGQPRKYLRSVLYMAKENNQTECIKLLLDRGAKE